MINVLKMSFFFKILSLLWFWPKKSWFFVNIWPMIWLILVLYSGKKLFGGLFQSCLRVVQETFRHFFGFRSPCFFHICFNLKVTPSTQAPLRSRRSPNKHRQCFPCCVYSTRNISLIIQISPGFTIYCACFLLNDFFLLMILR